MRRIILLVAGVLALAIAVPGAASAHGRHHGHHHHNKAKHARVKHFAGRANVDPSGPAAPGDAGTVASYDATTGLLTITLADGSSVSGKVTQDTNINCIPAQPTATTSNHDAGDDDQGDQGDQGDDQGDQGDQGNDNGSHCGGQSACDASDLVAGAVVHEAILKIGAGGAEFKLVLLVKQPATA